MGSEDQGKKESLEEYEKDYLERLQKHQDGQSIQDLIYNLSKDFKKPEEAKDYLGYCTFCTMGVDRTEMTYQNGQLFHSNCFEQQGKNFPAPNQELLKESSSAKVQLVLLKNLKIRTAGASSPASPKPKPKTKKKSKRKAKKQRPKRRTAKKRIKTKKRRVRRKKVSKRKRTKRKVSRRTAPKRRKAKRRTAKKTKKRITRKTKKRASKRKTRRRR